MQLQTVIDIEPLKNKITPKSKIVLLGSCFTSNIGQRMVDNKFEATANPMGALYNPASIARALELMQENKIISTADLEYCNGLYYSFDFHSSFSSTNPVEAVSNMNRALEMGRRALEQSDFIILTWGTAWVYTLKESGQTVANCHKEPSSKFNRHLLSIEEITSLATNLTCSAPYRSKQIILTVSPIRHLSDGARGNMVSKAHLIAASNAIIEKSLNTSYFPAFEIMMDELRDYRFFEEDMIHPTKMAIDYIWERFMASGLSPEAIQMVKELQRIRLAMGHRPFNTNTPAYKIFVLNTLKQISILKEKYPAIRLNDEVNFLLNSLPK